MKLRPIKKLLDKLVDEVQKCKDEESLKKHVENFSSICMLLDIIKLARFYIERLIIKDDEEKTDA